SAPKCRKVHCPCIEGRVTFNPASPLNEVQQTSGHPPNFAPPLSLAAILECFIFMRPHRTQKRFRNEGALKIAHSAADFFKTDGEWM
ncbi:hypothetical protein VSX64_24035, partial [Aurantimonas sp. C2-6-R+9]|uniref:hypothetical protein n=1 Tax=Aurantimonas sp. C2-6-R+9 TaxID=3114365 RepID=UPI002E18DC87|nr:hypothetical protein [Aurantimonas sp. C2-6-R+9]